jgi:hypothetical protein
MDGDEPSFSTLDDESPREEEGEVLDEVVLMNDDQPFNISPI